jgi:ATP/maltotriose-dependent transcriptional regulator MalT
MNIVNIVIFGGLSIFILFLFFYILKLEKAIEQKFAAMELSLEELNKEMFLVKKQLKNDDTLKTLERLERIIESIVDDVRIMEEKNREFYQKIEHEIAKINLEVRKSNLPNVSALSKHEEEKVISLYKSGYSIEEISRELRIPAGEIELIVKFSNL